MGVPEFHVIEPPPFWSVAAFAAGSICVEIGASLAVTAYLYSGLLWIAGGFGILYWRAGPILQQLLRDAIRYFRVRVRVHIVPSILMIILTLIGLRPALHKVFGDGSEGSGKARREERTNSSRRDDELMLGVDHKAGQAPSFADTQPGVILTAETKPHPILVPPMPAIGTGAYRFTPSKPLSIPFYGVYHIFRKKEGQLPRNSFKREGSPATLRFRSTDSSPITMEAHQNLATFIDVACCAAIQIGITNADPYRFTVAVELILINTQSKQSQSLGTVPVTSSVVWIPGTDTGSVSDVLTFRMPGTTGLRRFDEITVRFHLSLLRAERSARIAIDRFVLVPPGV